MNIINKVKSNIFTTRRFIDYLVSKNYDFNSIVKNENHLDTLMYYIEFLESEKVYIIVDHNGYVIYKQFDETIQVTIDCKFIPSVIARYVVAIISGFNYLENPF